MPSSAPPTAANEDSNADRFYDLSLRILMVVVSVGLVGSVAFLTYRWVAPPRPAPTHVPLFEVGTKPLPAATPSAPPAPKGEVLMAPGQIFKCEVDGRITFSEQPCTAGAEKKTDNGSAKAARSR